MKLFNEYKDLFTADELANVWGSTVCQANWRYGQTSRPDLELQFPMWFQEYWNCWKQEWFPVAPVEFINCIHERFIDVVKKETEYDDWILTRSMIAGNTFGLDGDAQKLRFSLCSSGFGHSDEAPDGARHGVKFKMMDL